MSWELQSCYYEPVPSDFGTLSIIWQEVKGKPRVYRVFLPNERTSKGDFLPRTFALVKRLSCPNIAELGRQIQGFLKGGTTSFGLSMIALEECSEFQRRVLLAEYRIPRSWVSTYGKIAQILEVPAGARAVGRALSQNPFPIIIPCHRAIRSNGELGGFQGGLQMKRALLELEGVEFSASGSVITDRIYY